MAEDMPPLTAQPPPPPALQPWLPYCERAAAGATVTAAGAAAVGVEEGVTSAGLLPPPAHWGRGGHRDRCHAAAGSSASAVGGTASAGAAEVVHCWAAEGVS